MSSIRKVEDLVTGDVFEHHILDNVAIVEVLGGPIALGALHGYDGARHDVVIVSVRVLATPDGVNLNAEETSVAYLSGSEVMLASPPRSRDYLISLPVAITVSDDGSVRFDVDLSEASDLGEDEDAVDRYGDDLVCADVAHVDNRLRANDTFTHTFTL